MEQPSTMDKKSQMRSVPAVSKNSQDPKSGFDYISKKNGVQYARKRENDKFDGKKSYIRSGRAGQRYVRPREKVGCQVEPNDTSEIGSLQKSGSKKQNITHLLNWWGPGPEQISHRNYGREHGYSRGYKVKKQNLQCQKYNKEHYLHTNCQFVVASGHDYAVYENDPDHLLDWKLVEEVRLHMTEAPSCPICLYPPVAAKVTRCGHIFCFACILHYLALSDEKWRSCPICYETITLEDLKSVTYIIHKDFSSNQEIELKLMRRERDSLIPVPADSLLTLSKSRVSLSAPDERLSYSKLIIASNDEVSKFIVGREIDSLTCQLAVDGDEPEACFIKDALILASERNSVLKALKESKDLTPQNDTTMGATAMPTIKKTPEKKLNRSLSCLSLENKKQTSLQNKQKTSNSVDNSDLKAMSDDVTSISPEDLDIEPLQTNSSAQAGKELSKSSFYFYQESGGAHIYLHALNVHMLVKEYGSLENCPKIIKAKVLEKESDSMTESLRQRLRYLRHLPLACPFEVVEIEMIPPLVSEMTIVEYQGQLEHRERKRKKRAKEEHRIEKRAQVEEDRLMGRSKGSKINMTSYKHFPSFNDQARPVFVPTETGNKSNSTEDDFPNLSPPSFAQMIRCGQKKMETQIASGSMPSYSQKSADAKSSKTNETKGSRNNDDASDDEYEEGERVPDYSTAFSDAFAKALEQASKKFPSEEDNDNNGQRRKKGKKKKAIVLLSSGGR
ncbi:UNVERIFIED_CONTAM: hypothetical protein RMT77_009054 [Armadillidium vulgare]